MAEPDRREALGLLSDVRLDVQLDTIPNAVRSGTTNGVLRHGALGLFPHPGGDGQRISHADTSDPKNFVDGFDIALDSGSDLVGRCGNVAHFQCACQGAEQSSADGGHHVVQGRRHILFRLDTVEGLDSTVHAKADRGVEPFEKRLTRWPLDPFNS